MRLGVRLGFATEERTAMQWPTPREAEVEKANPAKRVGNGIEADRRRG